MILLPTYVRPIVTRKVPNRPMIYAKHNYDIFVKAENRMLGYSYMSTHTFNESKFSGSLERAKREN
ncbi:MAG: hypothetical protein ACRCR2_02600 [Fusobacteriaceae bacterium]